MSEGEWTLVTGKHKKKESSGSTSTTYQGSTFGKKTGQPQQKLKSPFPQQNQKPKQTAPVKTTNTAPKPSPPKSHAYIPGVTKNPGPNKQHTMTHTTSKKLEDDDEDFKVKRVDTQLAANIQKARQEKNLTQKELATMVNEKLQVLQEYESGSAIPNEGVIVKLEKALGKKLRGKLADK